MFNRFGLSINSSHAQVPKFRVSKLAMTSTQDSMTIAAVPDPLKCVVSATGFLFGELVRY